MATTNLPSADPRQWDADTAAAALVLAALGFLFLIRKGFRPIVISGG